MSVISLCLFALVLFCFAWLCFINRANPRVLAVVVPIILVTIASLGYGIQSLQGAPTTSKLPARFVYIAHSLAGKETKKAYVWLYELTGDKQALKPRAYEAELTPELQSALTQSEAAKKRGRRVVISKLHEAGMARIGEGNSDSSIGLYDQDSKAPPLPEKDYDPVDSDEHK